MQTTKTKNSNQLDLFTAVLHAYAGGEEKPNSEIYETVKIRTGLKGTPQDIKVPIGNSGVERNLIDRKIRWHQQTLKHAGILTQTENRSGIWHLTEESGKDLQGIQNNVALLGYSTNLGIAILGSCDHVFNMVDSPVHLVITSPPYPLSNPRAYGNVSEAHYVEWICETLTPLFKTLADGASVCLNLTNDVFKHKSPARSTYKERLLIALEDKFGLQVMDTLIWDNPSKPPGPFQYASKSRVQLNVAYEPVYWLTNNPHKVRSNNKRVLQAHSEKHLKLIHAGGESAYRVNSDGAYRIRQGAFSNPTEGKIPKNILKYSHTCQSQREYKEMARMNGLQPHGATMPLKLASFLVEFMSEPNDLVADPFSGSGTTALAAELLGRRWLSTEKVVDYVVGSSYRFEAQQGFSRILRP